MKIDILKKVLEIKALCESESKDGCYYIVELKGEDWTCTCKDFTVRKSYCKHINEVKSEVY